MKADYKNWMPKGMVTGTGCGSGALTILLTIHNLFTFLTDAIFFGFEP